MSIAVCLMGPTASGKTALAVELVKRDNFEIISVDSALIYRGMDIGTAKPDAETLRIAPHHLIDILNPVDTFSVAQCVIAIKAAIKTLVQRGKRPLLVGGTMMYFHALQNGLASLPESSPALRDSLHKKAAEFGWPALHTELAGVDAVSAARIHPHDAQRIGRALEVFYLTGQPLSFLQSAPTEPQEIQYQNYLLYPENRALLHARIAKRFELMLQQGFIDEVSGLLRTWPLTLHHPALRCVGYRQAYEYLNGTLDYDGFCAKTLAATRQLAKRQLTWLRHWENGERIACDATPNPQEILAKIHQKSS